MPVLVPVGFVYKHGSPCSTCTIKRTLRFWYGSNCVPGISFAYLYAYSKKSFGYFNYLIGYLRRYAAYLELCIDVLSLSGNKDCDGNSINSVSDSSTDSTALYSDTSISPDYDGDSIISVSDASTDSTRLLETLVVAI